MCSYAKEHFLWFKTPAFQLREKPSRLGAAGAGRQPCPGAQSSRAGTAGRTALSEVLIRAPGARAEGRAAQGGRAGGRGLLQAGSANSPFVLWTRQRRSLNLQSLRPVFRISSQWDVPGRRPVLGEKVLSTLGTVTPEAPVGPGPSTHQSCTAWPGRRETRRCLRLHEYSFRCRESGHTRPSAVRAAPPPCPPPRTPACPCVLLPKLGCSVSESGTSGNASVWGAGLTRRRPPLRLQEA